MDGPQAPPNDRTNEHPGDDQIPVMWQGSVVSRERLLRVTADYEAEVALNRKLKADLDKAAVTKDLIFTNLQMQALHEDIEQLGRKVRLSLATAQQRVRTERSRAAAAEDALARLQKSTMRR